MAELTHFNETGEAHMVNVGAKDATHRIAVAEGTIRMQDSTLALIMEGGHKKEATCWASPGSPVSWR